MVVVPVSLSLSRCRPARGEIQPQVVRTRALVAHSPVQRVLLLVSRPEISFFPSFSFLLYIQLLVGSTFVFPAPSRAPCGRLRIRNVQPEDAAARPGQRGKSSLSKCFIGRVVCN